MGYLELYKDCKIVQEENFILKENNSSLALGYYLSTLVAKTFPNVKFNQNKLDIEFKVVLDKYSADEVLGVANDNYNYAMYRQQLNGRPAYYFIKKREALSSNCVKFYLHLDVLNSFNEGFHYTFSNLTHITRQHKDRYKINESNLFVPHIDEYSEGFTPVLYKKAEHIIKEMYENVELNISWYLLYRTNEQGKVECLLLCDSHTDVYIRFNDGVDFTYIYISPVSPKQIDLTDNKIIKIIKLPYFPANIIGSGIIHDAQQPAYEGKTYILVSENDWYYSTISLITGNAGDTIILKSSALSTSLVNQIGLKDDLVSLNPLCNKAIDLPVSITATRVNYANDPMAEPKLFHSDYYFWKYVYDSFIKVVKNEAYLNKHYTLDDSYYKEIYFYMTNTINSRFMFEMHFFDKFNFNNEDFERFLVVQRNNELTIYSSDFVNYLKTGYNYDVKNKNRQESFSWFTTGVGLTAGILSLIAGSKTLGAGLIASSVLSIANSVNTTLTLENNMEQKIAQLRNQGASVYGADDVDLMTSYNMNNKLWRAKYEVSPRMKKALADLFFYTGYIDDVTEVPNTNTRVWFNFLQCEPHFTKTQYISDECLEELIKKFKGGVTYLHMNTINNERTWNFERNKENWERILLIGGNI